MTTSGEIIRFDNGEENNLNKPRKLIEIAQGVNDLCFAKKDIFTPNALSENDEQNLIIVKEGSSYMAPITNPNEVLQPIEAKFFSTSALQRHSDVKFQAIVAGDQHVRKFVLN